MFWPLLKFVNISIASARPASADAARTANVRTRRMSWLQFESRKAGCRRQKLANTRSFLPSALAFHPEIAPKISRKPDPHRSQVDYCGGRIGAAQPSIPRRYGKATAGVAFFQHRRLFPFGKVRL